MAISEKSAAISNSDALLWAVPNMAQLVWLGWDGFYMVFNPASGEMHLLDALAREIIDIIAEKPRADKELLGEMESVFERPLDQALSEKIMGSLAELDKIGLVEPVDNAAASL